MDKELDNEMPIEQLKNVIKFGRSLNRQVETSPNIYRRLDLNACARQLALKHFLIPRA